MFEDRRLPEEVTQELFVEANGDGFMTQSAIGRLVGIAQQNINKLLVNLATPKNLSEPLKPFAGMDFRATPKIPDYVVGAIVIHYAMYARKKTDKAKKLAVVLASCSIRTLIQKTLGWQPETKPEKPMTLAEQCLMNAQALVEQERKIGRLELGQHGHRQILSEMMGRMDVLSEGVLSMMERDVMKSNIFYEELSEDDATPLTLRKKVWDLINKYCYVRKIDHKDGRNFFYNQLKLRDSFDAVTRAKNIGVKPIDIIAQTPGMMEKLYAIVTEYIKKEIARKPEYQDFLSKFQSDLLDAKPKEFVLVENDSDANLKQLSSEGNLFHDQENNRFYTVNYFT